VSTQILWDNAFAGGGVRITPWAAPALSPSTFDAAVRTGEPVTFAADFGERLPVGAFAAAGVNLVYRGAGTLTAGQWRIVGSINSQPDAIINSPSALNAQFNVSTPSVARESFPLTAGAALAVFQPLELNAILLDLRSTVSGSNAFLTRDWDAEIGHVFAGPIMTLPRGPKRGFRPRGMAREWQMHARRTISGTYLGQTAFEKAGTTEAIFDTIPEAFVREQWEPFRHHAAQGLPFFFNFDSVRRPGDFAFCVCDKPPPAPRLDQHGFAQLRLPITYLDLYRDST